MGRKSVYILSDGQIVMTVCIGRQQPSADTRFGKSVPKCDGDSRARLVIRVRGWRGSDRPIKALDHNPIRLRDRLNAVVQPF